MRDVRKYNALRKHTQSAGNSIKGRIVTFAKCPRIPLKSQMCYFIRIYIKSSSLALIPTQQGLQRTETPTTEMFIAILYYIKAIRSAKLSAYC